MSRDFAPRKPNNINYRGKAGTAPRPQPFPALIARLQKGEDAAEIAAWYDNLPNNERLDIIDAVGRSRKFLTDLGKIGAQLKRGVKFREEVADLGIKPTLAKVSGNGAGPKDAS